jgi:hypothetical protein
VRQWWQVWLLVPVLGLVGGLTGLWAATSGDGTWATMTAAAAGMGTPNGLAKWTTANTLGDSLLRDNGTKVTQTSGYFATAVEQGVQLQTQGTPFSLHTASTVFNGTRDNALFLAYNLATGSFSAKVVDNEPQLKFGFESDYNNGVSHLMEYNLDYLSADGLTRERFLSFVVDRATHAGMWSLVGTEVRLESSPNAGEFVFTTTDPALTLKSPTGAVLQLVPNLFDVPDTTRPAIATFNQHLFLQTGAGANAQLVLAAPLAVGVYTQDRAAESLHVYTADANIADTETALLVRRNVGGTYSLVRISMDAADSCDTGYRCLRVPN